MPVPLNPDWLLSHAFFIPHLPAGTAANNDTSMKYLLIAVLSLWSMFSYCQVYKFKSFATSLNIRDDKGNIIHESKNNDAHIPIILDFEKNTLKIFGQAPLVISFTKYQQPYENEDGDAIQKIAAIDKSGQKCAVVIIIYKHPHFNGAVSIIDVSYPKMDLAYEVKKQE